MPRTLLEKALHFKELPNHVRRSAAVAHDFRFFVACRAISAVDNSVSSVNSVCVADRERQLAGLPYLNSCQSRILYSPRGSRGTFTGSVPAKIGSGANKWPRLLLHIWIVKFFVDLKYKFTACKPGCKRNCKMRHWFSAIQICIQGWL